MPTLIDITNIKEKLSAMGDQNPEIIEMQKIAQELYDFYKHSGWSGRKARL